MRKNPPESVRAALKAAKPPPELKQEASAFSEKTADQAAAFTSLSAAEKKTARRRGARHIPHYLDQHEDYIPVSRSLLRELSTLGWLQEGAGGAGMFFFSGAFWLLVTLLAEHFDERSKYAAWILLCVACMIFGGVLVWVGYRHFALKQQRVQDAFRADADSDNSPK